MRDFQFISELNSRVISEFLKTAKKSKLYHDKSYKKGLDDGVAFVLEQVQKILGDNSLVIVDRLSIADMEWLQEAEQGDAG